MSTSTYVDAIILGIVQGVTEFLPISSSAHLRIVGEFLPAATDPGATFTAITQIGTELAVVLFFWRDITRILNRWFAHVFRRGVPASDPDVRMGWLIIIGSVPIAVAGYLGQEYIRDTFRSLWLVAIVLIGFGLLLGLADYLGRRTRELTDLTYPHGLYYGLAQMLALVPGVSRSGATTTMGLALGYTRPAAARYAFLLAIPAVFGSGFYELRTALLDPTTTGPFGWGETLVATGIAFVIALVVIAGLMAYISKRSFLPFVIYRVLLGSTILVLLSMGVLEG
ncbi:undecaprenyl-diphosphate phosphatase [Microcella sp.]|uniref:undecaprenyl-diphosphate phosphatase n=1 Tax=Microcella sp. TaxID=1913979 RepID=UPI0039194DCA